MSLPDDPTATVGNQPAKPTPFFERWYGRIERLLLLLIAYCLNLTVVNFVACVSALLLRQWLVPPVDAIELPLHFVFSTCDTQLADVCSYPEANVSLLSPNEPDVRYVTPGVPYQLSVRLSVPPQSAAAASNIGLFMLVARTYSVSGQLVASHERSFSLWQPDPSSQVAASWFSIRYWLRAAGKLCLWPLWLVGYFEDRPTPPASPSALAEHVFVLTERLFDRADLPAYSISVQLQNRHVQVQSAWLRLTASLGLLTRALYHYPLSSLVVLHLSVAAPLFACSTLYWTHQATTHFTTTTQHVKLD